MSEKDGEEEKRENRGLSTDYIHWAMHQAQRESEGEKREVIRAHEKEKWEEIHKEQEKQTA